MRNGRFSDDLVTSNMNLNVILAKNHCTNDKKVTKKKKKKNFMIFPNCRFQSGKLGFVARPACWRYLQEKLQWSGGTSARIYNQCMYEAIVLF